MLVDTKTGPWQLAAMRAVAAKSRIELQVLEVSGAAELDRALGAGVRSGSRALVQLSSPLFDTLLAKRIADFSLKHRLPGIVLEERIQALEQTTK